MTFLQRLRCNHEWVTHTDKFLESNVERLSRLSIKKFRYFPDDLEATHVVIMVCNKCGKIDKTVTRT